MVAELQVAFVVFLVGQNMAGWERWRRLVDVLCRAEGALGGEPALYEAVMGVLHFQIAEVGLGTMDF